MRLAAHAIWSVRQLRSFPNSRFRHKMRISLAALNQPAAVAAAGTGAFILLPFVEDLAAKGVFTWAQLKGAAAAAYALQVVCVSIPGRIDGEMAKELQDENDSVVGDEAKKLSSRNGRTLVAPAGWAFAIWGPIFMGELVSVISQLSIPADDPLVPLLRKTSVPFAFAHIFQSLWCAAFRRKYSGNLMYISFGMLASTAYSLSMAHAAFAAESSTYSGGTYAKLFLSLSLHTGWTVAASIVNLNGAFSMKESSGPRAIALLGHASVVAATAVGVAVTTMRSAPVFGGVISWALLAVADGMKQRIEKAKKKDDMNASNLIGAANQRKLSLLGAAVSGVAVLVTTAKMFLLPKVK